MAKVYPCTVCSLQGALRPKGEKRIWDNGANSPRRLLYRKPQAWLPLPHAKGVDSEAKEILSMLKLRSTRARLPQLGVLIV
jgi:hypothetical protein